MNGKGTIQVHYKCACLAAEVEIPVPARRGPAQHVVHWVETIVGHAIKADHEARSPKCRRTTMEYVKIPSPPDKLVGSE